jgi:carboxyl-terminal processing protease
MNDRYEAPPRWHFPPFLLLLAAFAAGVFLDRAGWIPGRSDRQPAHLGKTFAPFWEAWRKVQDHYVDRTRVDDGRLTQGAIRGMLHELGDPGHTTYLTPQDRARLKRELAGQMYGIGASIGLDKGQPTIVTTVPGSPAQAAGIRPGDVVLAVNGKGVDGLRPQEVVSKMSGPTGGTLQLRVRRAGKDRDVALKRGTFEVPMVSWRLLPGSAVAHVALRRFGTKADVQLRQALTQARSEGARALILDLRGNPGGLKEQAIAVASEFLQKGQVVFLQEDARGEQEAIRARAGGRAVDLPLCVLIDRSTASSAEILAGALQDHRRGKLVGLPTYGTGTVVREYPLSDGSAVRLAIYQWLTPGGRRIWRRGVAPDKGLEVALLRGDRILFPEAAGKLTPADLTRIRDRQLLKALEVLNKDIGAGAATRTARAARAGNGT